MPVASPDDEQALVDRRDGADTWLSQAQWLYAQESQRLDSIRTRCAALVGVSGAVLAILARQQSNSPSNDTANAVAVIASVSSICIFLLSAGVASTALWGVAVSRPSHAALSEKFRRWREEVNRHDGAPTRAVFLQRDFAVQLFDSEQGEQDSPLSTLTRAASRATDRFHVAAGAFVVGLAVLGTSIVVPIIWR